MSNVINELNKNCQFDAFTVELNNKNAINQVKALLSPDWVIEEVEEDGLELDIVPKDTGQPSIEEINSLYEKLNTIDEIINVEVAIEEECPEIIDIESFEPELGNFELNAEDYEWSLKMVKADKAWELEPKNSRYGEGVRIAHPDSGYRDHYELNPANDNRLLLTEDYDFVGKDDDPLINNKSGGHGLGTASVIISGINRPVDGRPFVTGIAPKAELMPLRVAKWKRIGTPVLFNGGVRRLRKAINYAVKHDCHVISISLGSANLSWSLHKAIKRAVKKGVIVLAAAGNRVKMVTIPARYNEVIAVAGCDSNMRPWSGSSRGRDVDVTAPAKGVWKAAYKNGEATVLPGNGTSFAVATTAGVAALWLGYWGRDALIEHYGSPERMVIEFKKLLETTCNRDNNLPQNSNKWGAGIVDAEKLLSVELF